MWSWSHVCTQIFFCIFNKKSNYPRVNWVSRSPVICACSEDECRRCSSSRVQWIVQTVQWLLGGPLWWDWHASNDAGNKGSGAVQGRLVSRHLRDWQLLGSGGVGSCTDAPLLIITSSPSAGGEHCCWHNRSPQLLCPFFLNFSHFNQFVFYLLNLATLEK